MITEFNEYCIICGKPAELHHIFKGVKQRSLCTEDELLLPLCPEHHRGNMSVHQKKELNILCQIIGQLAYEKQKVYEGMLPAEARIDFTQRYSKSYL